MIRLRAWLGRLPDDPMLFAAVLVAAFVISFLGTLIVLGMNQTI